MSKQIFQLIRGAVWRSCLHLAKTSYGTLMTALVHQIVFIALAVVLIVGDEVRPRVAVVIVMGVLVAVFVSFMEQKKLWLILAREWDRTIWEIDEEHIKEKEALIAWYTKPAPAPAPEPQEERTYWEFDEDL